MKIDIKTAEDVIDNRTFWQRLFFSCPDNVAMSSEEWRKLRKHDEKYFIRYFLFDTIPLEFSRIKRRFKDLKYWFLYRLSKKHQYHVIKPKTLKPNYHDPDTLLLHSVFHILCDYKENEMDRINWAHSEEAQEIAKKINDAYEYWTVKRPALVEEEDHYVTLWSELRSKMCKDLNVDFLAGSKKIKEHEDYDKSEKYFKKSRTIEERVYKTDTKHLLNIVKIRSHLWS